MRKYSNTSRDAALASWAAWEQGKFWEMHDLLFSNAPDLDPPVLERIAGELGLDMDRFRKAMQNEAYLKELQTNLDRIHDLDIWSTPTTIINGVMIKGAQPYENYKKAVEDALKEAGSAAVPSLLERLGSLLGPREAAAEGKIFGQGQVPLYVQAPRLKATNEPKVGEAAPDFRLPAVGGTTVALSDFKGKKNVLLTFLPAAFTPV